MPRRKPLIKDPEFVRAVWAYIKGERTAADVAGQFGCSVSTVCRWAKLLQEKAELAVGPGLPLPPPEHILNTILADLLTRWEQLKESGKPSELASLSRAIRDTLLAVREFQTASGQVEPVSIKDVLELPLCPECRKMIAELIERGERELEAE